MQQITVEHIEKTHPFVDADRQTRLTDDKEQFEAKAGDDGPFVDASLAPIIEQINDMGLTTLQSESGVDADHPARNQQPKEGYIAIKTDCEVTRTVIERAADEAGIVTDRGGYFGENTTAFGAPGITVRMPGTNDGTATLEIRDIANDRFKQQTGRSIHSYKGGDYDDFLDALDVRNEIKDQVAEEHGGYFTAPDADIISLWEAFVAALDREMQQETRLAESPGGVE